MEKKKPINIVWNELLSPKDEGPPPELVVVGRREQEQSPSQSQKDNLECMSDHELNESIRRIRGEIDKLAPKLPDKGAKLRASLQRFEEELENRNLIKLKLRKDADECEKPMHSQSSSFSGSCNGCSSEAPSSQAHSQSSFATLFSEKLEEKPDCSTRNTVNGFDKEISYLGHSSCQNKRPNGFPLDQDKQKRKVSSRQSTFQCPKSNHLDGNKHKPPSGVQKVVTSPSSSISLPDRNLSSCLSKRRKASQVPNSLDSRTRKSQTLVLVDEEDCQPIRTTQQDYEQVGWVKEAKIYYPSRDDPECVELCHSDIECLGPEAFLSSTIMNFYIRYLQRPISATGRSRGDYHFFNTYFYEKLKEAVSYKGSGKETFFSKFRRWWKGVNIFQKAYILLPIHDNLHWSLVIICIPDKEDESGPIILHLDSLGYHFSKQIFQNIKSYLVEEWNYLNQGVIPPDLPIAERIWKHLDRRIDDKIITVPQQKNDYDCGIFVLFFMERFIEDAPQRLRKKDLSMFGRQWFKPEEASGLRERIRKLLLEEFQNARIENDIIESSSPTSSGDAPAGCIEDTPDS